MNELQEEFQYFIINCTRTPGVYGHYDGGLRNLVTERLQALNLIDGDKNIYDYDNPEDVSGFLTLLNEDANFIEVNSRGHNMYSSALSSYIMFLNARQYFSTIKSQSVTQLDDDSLPLQQIFYGAPGTGKSHTIKIQTENEEVVRTTFHPDSDYSTFVGCYKPTMEKTNEEVYSLPELKDKLNIKRLSGEVYPCQKFAAQYWYSLSKLSLSEIKEIIADCGFTESMCQEINKGCAVGKYFAESKKGNICYSFVAQAFLHAYVKAWKFYAEKGDNPPKKQFLIIEEINRGNCAQIFGDLFQLLDRNSSGFSEYSILADNDLRQYLLKEFDGLKIANSDEINALYKEKDVVDKVLSGKILLLPNNLYIWATMNTSDQSLFPIDSAFKRRWDWVYVPIAEGVDKKTNQTLSWKIVIDDKAYDWWEFLGKINEQIGATTNSEDKKLGFFFCQADSNGEIDAEKFVGKVLFYLWNDVFKDYGLDGDLFKDNDDKILTYDKFYKTINGITEIDVDNVQKFLNNLKVDGEDVDVDVFDSPEDAGKKPRVLDKSKYSINGEGVYKKGATVKQSVEKYVSNHPEKTGEEIIHDWMEIGIDIPYLIQTEAEYLERTKNDTMRRGNPIQVHENDVIYVSNQLNVERMNDFISKVNQQDWGIHIEKVSD